MESAASIQLLVLDVDGVLTDGSIFLSDSGEETKRFNVRDGFGIRLWQRMGFRAAIITGRTGKAVKHRCAELGIDELIQGSKDKLASLDDLCRRTGTTPEQVAFVGDDWPDLSAMKRAGLAIAPADADERIREISAFVTRARGGDGAVREAIETLLAAKGILERALGLFQ